jgi:hypothetical protein
MRTKSGPPGPLFCRIDGSACKCMGSASLARFMVTAEGVRDMSARPNSPIGPEAFRATGRGPLALASSAGAPGRKAQKSDMTRGGLFSPSPPSDARVALRLRRLVARNERDRKRGSRARPSPSEVALTCESSPLPLVGRRKSRTLALRQGSASASSPYEQYGCGAAASPSWPRAQSCGAPLSPAFGRAQRHSHLPPDVGLRVWLRHRWKRERNRDEEAED